MEEPAALMQAFWKSGGGSGDSDDVGYLRRIPRNGSVLDWNNAGPWEGPLTLTGLPGTGSIVAQGDVRAENTVYQTAWRDPNPSAAGDEQGWVREVAVINNVVQWHNPGPWNTSNPLTLTGMSGSGSIQAQDNYVIGNRVWQDIWRSNKRYTRWVPISGGQAQWGAGLRVEQYNQRFCSA